MNKKRVSSCLNLSLLTCSICLLSASFVVQANTLTEQRSRYQQALQALNSEDKETLNRLLPRLKQYPLYPYLEDKLLAQKLSDLSLKEVEAFTKKYAGMPFIAAAQDRFFRELVKREDWKGLLAFTKQEPKNLTKRCQYNYAKFAVGNKQEAFAAVNNFWVHDKSLPKACDGLVKAWSDAGYLNSEITLKRIALASNSGSAGRRLSGYLIKQLPDSQQNLGKEIVRLQDRPTELLEFAKNNPPSDFIRSVVLQSFPVLAKQDIQAARALVPKLVESQKLNDTQKKQLEKNIVSRLFVCSASNDNIVWRDKMLQQLNDGSLIERRLRTEFWCNSKPQVLNWIKFLPEASQKKEEWRYWKGYSLLNSASHSAEGRAILDSLSQERGFYPMVAAQILKKPYRLKVVKVNKNAISKQEWNAVLARDEVKRIRELRYWQEEKHARSEWINLVSSFDLPYQEQAARYALEQDWLDLSVQATILGKMWNHLEERFPAAYPKLFNEYTTAKSISRTYAMGIARQESAWNAQARSGVGAAGLMQLMPATAKETAQKIKLLEYKDASQLFDPKINIQLGTAYLDAMYLTFGNNRILASAAYNAGPNRVKNWLKGTAGKIETLAFVEGIPFTETRNYVKNVLSYDMFFQHFTRNKMDTVLTKEELNRTY